MGITSNCNGVHGVPDCRRITIGEICSFAIVGLKAAGMDNLCLDSFNLRKFCFSLKRGHRLDPCGNCALCLHFKRSGINRRLLGSVHLIHDGCRRIRIIDRNHSCTRASDTYRLHTGSFNRCFLINICLVNRTDDNRETVFISFHSVGIKRTALTAACSSETGDTEVKMKNIAVILRQFVRMIREEEFHLGIRDCSCRHQFGSNEDSATVSVSQSCPTNLLTVAVALRTGVVGELVSYFR